MRRIFEAILILTILSGVSISVFGKISDTHRVNWEIAALTVSATVYYGDEDEMDEPIKGEFYLLNGNIIESLKRDDFELVDENDVALVSDESYLEATASALTNEYKENELVAVSIESIINKNKIAVLKTDRRGRSKLKTIKPGIITFSDTSKLTSKSMFGMCRSDSSVKKPESKLTSIMLMP